MNSKTKNLLNISFRFLIIAVLTYAFLSLCNWNINVGEWNGFSRFMLGFEGVIFFFILMDSM